MLCRGSGLPLEFEGHAGGVAVHDWHSVAGSADSQALLINESLALGVNGSENLASLRFELVLLTTDERNHVVDNVHRRDARVACAGDRLHRDDADGRDGTESGLKGSEGDDEADDGTVGVADEEAFLEIVDGALVRDKFKVRQVDGRDYKRNERVATVVLCVGEDGDLSLDKLHLYTDCQSSVTGEQQSQWRTNLASDIRIQTTEDDIAVLEFRGLALPNNHLSNIANWRGLLPPHCILVLLAGGARGGTDRVELEGRVVGEEENKALTNGASAAEDTYKLYLSVFCFRSGRATVDGSSDLRRVATVMEKFLTLITYRTF